MKKNGFRPWLLVFLLLVPLGVAAQTCTVASTPLSFGNYDPASGAADEVTGSVTVTCSALSLLGLGSTVATNIALSTGQSRSFSPRRMSGADTNGLPYNLYTTGSHSIVWGDTTGGTATVPLTVTMTQILGLLGFNGSATATVYGQIPAGEPVTAGNYTDTLGITVTY